MKHPIAFGAQVISAVSKRLNLGHGSTWPGHIALFFRPNIIEDILQKSSTQVICIVGTNGKTTTATMLTTILKEAGKKVVQNTSGANLLNGIASAILTHTDTQSRLPYDYAVFEVDENSLPVVLRHITPKAIIALNLFRDQLDRYGELDSVARKWNQSLKKLTDQTTLILNADDPLIAYIAKDVVAKVVYFGLSEKEKGQKKLEHASDSTYCPNCGHKLVYNKIFFSHLGIWHCPNCGVKRPHPATSSVTSPLPGTYNEYNTLAAVVAATSLGIDKNIIDAALTHITPAFGRQEKLVYKGKDVQIFLSKNPTSMNQSLQTIMELSGYSSSEQSESRSSRQARTIKPSVLFVLNDRIPDGQDVSWIWDIDLESYMRHFKSIFISGDRVYDMGLRVAYSSNDKFLISNFKSNPNVQMFENLKEAIDRALEQTNSDETLYILPTYSAMLEVRKILTGRKIL